MNELQLITTDKMAMLDTYAKTILKSRIVPFGLDSEEKIKVVLLTGFELGLSPMRALSHLYVINGKCAQDVQTMLGLIREKVPTFSMETLVSDEKQCQINATRDGKKWEKFNFTFEEAVRAGLTNKDNWKKWPADMCFARCAARMSRRLFSDIIAGASYLPEELDQNIAIGPDNNPVSSYTATGDVNSQRAKDIQANLESLKDVTPGEKIETLSGVADVKKWADEKAAEAGQKAAAKNTEVEKQPKVAKKEKKPEVAVSATIPPAIETKKEEIFPTQEDLAPPPGANASDFEDYGNYKMPTGPLAGKTLKELGFEKVNELAVKTLKAVANMKPDEIKAHTHEFLHASECWLEGMAAAQVKK